MLHRLFSSNSFKAPIQVTNNAWSKIDYIMSMSRNNIGFLFSISSGGCNGFNYNLNLLETDELNELNKNKLKMSYIESNNLRIYIEQKSEFYLLGTTIDYINEDFSKNIFESKFIFKPDKEKASTCGCGVSFSPKLS